MLSSPFDEDDGEKGRTPKHPSKLPLLSPKKVAFFKDACSPTLDLQDPIFLVIIMPKPRPRGVGCYGYEGSPKKVPKGLIYSLMSEGSCVGVQEPAQSIKTQIWKSWWHMRPPMCAYKCPLAVGAAQNFHVVLQYYYSKIHYFIYSASTVSFFENACLPWKYQLILEPL